MEMKMNNLEDMKIYQGNEIIQIESDEELNLDDDYVASSGSDY